MDSGPIIIDSNHVWALLGAAIGSFAGARFQSEKILRKVHELYAVLDRRVTALEAHQSIAMAQNRRRSDYPPTPVAVAPAPKEDP